MSFLRQALTAPMSIGAVAPSSEGLVRQLTNTNLEDKECVVEWGTGNGVVTEKILERVSDRCVFFALEANRVLVDATRKRCPDARVYHDDAAQTGRYLDLSGRESCDTVISGLPWTAFDRPLQVSLLNTLYNSLAKDGEFLTFAYITSLVFPSGWHFRRLLQERFREVQISDMVWWNCPPAFVYHCRK